ERRYHGSDDFDVSVVPDIFLVPRRIVFFVGAYGGCALVGRAEVDSTQDRYGAICNEELAVIARVEAVMMLPRVERIEFDDLASGPPKLVEEGGVSADRADAVVDDPDVNARLTLAREQVAQHFPVTTHVFENVVLEIDVVFGRADCREHCRERLR